MNTQPMPIAITLPWPPKALSPNARVHFMVLAKAKKAYRNACYIQARRQGVLAGANQLAGRPLSVHLEFVPPTPHPRDIDNLVATMKSGLDGLADALGVDDAQFRLTHNIAQEIAGLVRVTITTKD